MTCEARREGDEMACACGLRWSVADAEPPKCRRIRHVVRAPADRRELLAAARREANFVFVTGDTNPLKNVVEGRRFAVHEPHVLPRDVALAMNTAYAAHHRPGADGAVEAMRAAFRVWLDSQP